MAFNYIAKRYKDWRRNSQFTEIVSDMEEESLFNEKQSISESGRSLKKYGSTCNHVRNTDVLIRHEVEKTDTLQGLALKYGCSTEQIRRTNRLFASDSLFLRQYLMIPVDKGSPFSPKDDRPHSLPPRAASIANSNDYNPLSDSNGTTPPINNSKSMDSVAAIILTPEEENKKCIDEFLGKIDSTIAQTKKYVKRSQNSFDQTIDDDMYGARRNQSSSSSSQMYYQQNASSSMSASSSSASGSSSSQHKRHSSTGSASDSNSHFLNQGRRVQNSLQRLEQQQDEFFEL